MAIVCGDVSNSLEGFKAIAFGYEEIQATGEDCSEFVYATQGVVEGDDATIACIAHHIVVHILCRETTRIVAGHKVPHHYPMFSPQPQELWHAEPSVGRTKQTRVEHLVSTQHILDICVSGVAEASIVVVGVVANGVTIATYCLKEMRMALSILSHHEEGGVDASLTQCV